MGYYERFCFDNHPITSTLDFLLDTPCLHILLPFNMIHVCSHSPLSKAWRACAEGCSTHFVCKCHGCLVEYVHGILFFLSTTWEMLHLESIGIGELNPQFTKSVYGPACCIHLLNISMHYAYISIGTECAHRLTLRYICFIFYQLP